MSKAYKEYVKRLCPQACGDPAEAAMSLQLHDTIVRNDCNACEELLKKTGLDLNKCMKFTHKIGAPDRMLLSRDVYAMPLHIACIYRRPELVRLIDPPEELTMDLWLLTHPDLRHTARVRALMTFLHDSLQSKVDLIEGREPRNTKNQLG